MVRRRRRQPIVQVLVLVENVIVTTASGLDSDIILTDTTPNTHGLYRSLMVAMPLRPGANS